MSEATADEVPEQANPLFSQMRNFQQGQLTEDAIGNVVVRRFSQPGISPAHEHARRTARVERDHVIGHGRTTGDFHARRTDGHSRHCNAHDLWALAQHTLDQVCRHMSFDNVTIDQGCMAAFQCSRNAITSLDIRQISYVVNLNGKTIVDQVRDPRTATTSGRRLVDGNNPTVRLWTRKAEPYGRQTTETEASRQ